MGDPYSLSRKTGVDGDMCGLYCGGILTVDLDALQHNYRVLAKKAAPAQAAAVVKANAYGIGVTKAAPALYEAGARVFFVAQLVEAFTLLAVLPKDITIAVLNDIQPGTEEIVADAGILPVLNSLHSVAAWAKLCSKRGTKLPAMLQLDTGMARLGLDERECEVLIKNPEIFQLADIRYILSHLASADEKQNTQNSAQLEKMQTLLNKLPPCPVALANSGGIFLSGDFRYDLVRPGIALYGVDPHHDTQTEIRPVVQLDARVIETRQVPAETKVGYNATFTTMRPTQITTIAVGYADGWHRTLSNRGAAYFNGARLPIIGRVSMDSITLDTTDLGENAPQRGDLVELIGPHQSLADVARDADTITYEILTSLGQRFDRRYLKAV